MGAVEVETLAELDERVGAGELSWAGWFLQSLDLTARAGMLAGADVAGATFLGCTFAPGSEEDVRRRGARVFPALPDLPFDPYRGRLYSPEELYRDLDAGYQATLDARTYAWARGPRALDRTLAAALHDHAVDDALAEYAAGRSVVGVMGGHDVDRGSPAYRAAALLGHRLGRRHVVATGGGPGAMEAANLGAYLSTRPESVLPEACTALGADRPEGPGITTWARAGFDVRRQWPGGGDSLGVPTWFYGHEPPNVFATHIAKYFTNAIREDVLLHTCTAGIVYLPGKAGTVQEIFQAACESFYAAEDPVPLVLVDTDGAWTTALPVWPLLERLLADRPVSLVATVEEAAERLG